MAQYAHIPTPWGQVGYRKMGRGSRLLIAFHGFGSDSRVFECLEPHLHDSCTVYALDLPFHGHTEWQAASYRPKQLLFIIEAVLALAGKPRFEAVGHSLGGRLWLCLLPKVAAKLDALYLLAPDGLHTRSMGLAEWPPLLLRRLLGHLANQPGYLLQMLRQFGLIDNFSGRYLQHHLEDAARRQRLLHTWYALYRFYLTPKKARQHLAFNKVPTLALLGKNDKLVSKIELQNTLQGLENVLIQEVNANHQSICQKAAPFLSDGLLRYWNHFNLLRQRQ
jgi:pimeloyl-ACP methyl ester carboxylesterase